MTKIRYAVVGIDPQQLSNLIGTLARGETDSKVDAVVIPALLPTVYAIDENSSACREIPFSRFLADQVGKARKIMAENSSGEKMINDVVEKTLALSSTPKDKG